MARKYKHPYIARHTDGGWRYQRGIPRELQALLGGRTHFSVYLKGARNETQAGAMARALAGQHDGLFERLHKLSAAQRAEVAAHGGIDQIRDTIPLLRSVVASAEDMRTPKRWHDPYRVEKLTDGAVPAARAALMFHGWHKKTDGERARKVQLARLEEIEATAAPAPQSNDYSFDGLFQLWVKVREAKKTDDHARTLGMLTAELGNLDYRHVTQAHMAKFRDALDGLAEKRKTTRTDKESARKWQVRQLENISALFSVAVSENKVAVNPVKGIKVRGKASPRKTGDDRPFTGKQVKHILNTAKRVRFGDNGRSKRHDAAMWVLRLLAWTGARPAEITQLRKVDVTKEGFHICADHEQQSVKNGESVRFVPFHPEVKGFYAYAQKADDFVFNCFPWNKHKGRRGWFDAEFGPFLREVCSIDAPGLTLYSLRHRYHDAMRDAGIAEDRQRYLVGHASGDVHGKYGRGAGLRELAKDVARIDVLRD